MPAPTLAPLSWVHTIKYFTHNTILKGENCTAVTKCLPHKALNALCTKLTPRKVCRSNDTDTTKTLSDKYEHHSYNELHHSMTRTTLKTAPLNDTDTTHTLSRYLSLHRRVAISIRLVYEYLYGFEHFA